MNLTELAAGLGISRQAASKLKKRGMPTATIAQAQGWRRRNTRSAVPTDPNAAASIAAGTLEELAAEGAPLPEDSAGLKEQLAMIGKVRRAAVARYERALEAEEDDNARRWAQVVLSLSQRGADAELKLKRALTLEGETIAYADAEAAFCMVLKEIRGHLDAMPANLAGKVNPGDAPHAQQILSDWRDMVCRALHAAPDKAREEARKAA
jgi:hypothetical protein